MDEFNNNNLENKNEPQNCTPANGQPYDPYNQQAPNPANGQPYDPYNQQAPNPANGQPYDPYNQQPTQGAVPYTYDPYSQSPNYANYMQNQYGGGVYAAPVKAPEGMATASLVMGILAIVSFITVYLPPVFAILGIVFGCIHKSKHYPNGNGKATAGIVCSVIGLLMIIGIIALGLSLMSNPEVMQQYMSILKDQDPDLYDQMYDMYYDQFPQWFEGIKLALSALFAK